MNLTNYYWYFKSVVPERICDDISKYGKQLQEQMAVTGGYGDSKKLNKKQVTDLKKKRDSDIVWMNDRWVYKEIQPYIHQANANAGWNFEWDWSESCQFTEYKKGQFYDWHCDSDDRKRIITAVYYFHKEPKKYKGGEIELSKSPSAFGKIVDDNKDNVITIPPENNMMVIFAGNVSHRVKATESPKKFDLGRFSVNCWIGKNE